MVKFEEFLENWNRKFKQTDLSRLEIWEEWKGIKCEATTALKLVRSWKPHRKYHLKLYGVAMDGPLYLYIIIYIANEHRAHGQHSCWIIWIFIITLTKMLWNVENSTNNEQISYNVHRSSFDVRFMKLVHNFRFVYIYSFAFAPRLFPLPFNKTWKSLKICILNDQSLRI